MEERKSILETVTPRDALGRLAARNKHSTFLMIGIAVVVLFAVAALVGLIISNASRGTSGVEVPQVIQR